MRFSPLHDRALPDCQMIWLGGGYPDAVAYGIYWFLVLRHIEETDDAYVAGNQVQIMAQVSGSVTKVW
ncbi:hypothetical protein MJN85_29975, partial [Salmonella enterica subsp. enterica serovar Anatum]|nr:hypothetical protein [Salmonella enterica subsp. enterica serovar Anatum]